MKRPAIRVGAKVEFKSWLFRPPYKQYFDKYKNQVFKVVEVLDKHYLLVCISDSSIKCDGGFHLDSLKLFKSNKKISPSGLT